MENSNKRDIQKEFDFKATDKSINVFWPLENEFFTTNGVKDIKEIIGLPSVRKRKFEYNFERVS